MIPLIIIFVLCLLYTFSVNHSDDGVVANTFFAIMYWAGWAIAWLITFNIGIILFLGGPDAQIDKSETCHTEIVLMADGSSTHGRISLFGGSIKTEPAYSYYYAGADGGLHLTSKLSSNSVIYQDTEGDAYVKCLEDEEVEIGWWYVNMSEGDVTYEFHVPRGSVQPGVNLDGG